MLLTMMLFAFASISNAQCTVNVVSAKVETNGGTGFKFKIQTDANVNFYDVQLKKSTSTTWTTAFKCVGVRNYISPTDDFYNVTIPKQQAEALGFAKGDDVRVVPHYGIVPIYEDCSTYPYCTPSATYTLKFKGN